MPALNPPLSRQLLFGAWFVAGSVLGLWLLLKPAQLAALGGLPGVDLFVYRLAGAATLAYPIGAIIGFRLPLAEVRIAIVAVVAWNVATILACVLSPARSETYCLTLILVADSLLFLLWSGWVLRCASPSADGPAIAPWLVGLLSIGTVADIAFALAPLVAGGDFGRLLGYSGADDLMYRLAGATTAGLVVAGLLALRSRRWAEVRIPVLMLLAFSAFSVVAALFEVLAGAAQPVTWLILVAGGFVAVGMSAALVRRGG